MANKAPFKSKPPAIAIASTSKNLIGPHKEFLEKIKEYVKAKFYIKYKSNSTYVCIEKWDDYDRYLEYIKNTAIEYHTFSIKKDKHHAFVLKGLGDKTEVGDIANYLEEHYNLQTLKIVRMKTKYKPMFMVVTNSDIKLKYLVDNMKSILGTPVTWERRNNERPIVQCHRCQLWGHATLHCNRAFRCLKCAENHPTQSCTKSPETPSKCCNCNGSHPANNVGCSFYKVYLNLKNYKPKDE